MKSANQSDAASRVFTGSTAAGGFAAGPICYEAVRPGHDGTPVSGQTNPGRERVRLDAAIAEATLALSELLDRFGVDVSSTGDLIVDTGTVLQTARSTVKTIAYPQGPQCV